MDRVFSNLQKANVKIHRVEGSSISKHLEDYKLKYRFHLKDIVKKGWVPILYQILDRGLGGLGL